MADARLTSFTTKHYQPNKNQKRMKRKDYLEPSTKVVTMRQQLQLLAGSDTSAGFGDGPQYEDLD